jgi:hypothetical protein
MQIEGAPAGAFPKAPGAGLGREPAQYMYMSSTKDNLARPPEELLEATISNAVLTSGLDRKVKV